MSSVEWIGASQVIRSLNGSSASRASAVSRSGSSSQASRERLGDPAVEDRVGLGVDHRALVGALEVDRVNGAGLDQALDQGVVPVGRGVELEAQVRVVREPAGDRGDRRRIAHPRRDDEGDRAELAADHVGQRGARLAQREVERRALERPAAVEAVDLAVGRAGREEVERPEVLGEAVEGPVAGQRQGRAVLLLGELERALVGDVLADTLLAAALDPDHGGEALEAARDRLGQPFEFVAVDREGQAGDALVGAHRVQPTEPAASPFSLPPRCSRPSGSSCWSR